MIDGILLISFVCLTGCSFAVLVKESAIFHSTLLDTLIWWDVEPLVRDSLPTFF